MSDHSQELKNTLDTLAFLKTLPPHAMLDGIWEREHGEAQYMVELKIIAEKIDKFTGMSRAERRVMPGDSVGETGVRRDDL